MATFVLVPGAGGQAWYWHRLVPELEARGHAALAVELPAADPNAGLVDYADVVVEAIGDHVDDPDLVVVGQSMGSYAAMLVCDRVPVRLLVLLNAMAPKLGESPGEQWEATGLREARVEQARRDGRDPDAPFDPVFEFLHDVPQEVIESGPPPPEQADKPFEDFPLERWPNVPIRFIQGRDDRFSPIEYQRRVVKERLGIELDELPGGHLLALSQPVALAEQLVSYLTTAV
jgi:pimeloyl-ACP methyl ester carboxylesterase